jgi:hypothetical protein
MLKSRGLRMVRAHLLFEPLTLLEKLAALTPRPRIKRRRCRADTVSGGERANASKVE